jgi:hypothetical protein
MAFKLTKYNGVADNGSSTTLTTIDLTQVSSGNVFTADILYSVRGVGNPTNEEYAEYRYINTFAKYGSNNYGILNQHQIIKFSYGGVNYQLTSSITGDTLTLSIGVTGGYGSFPLLTMYDCNLEFN